MSAVAKAGFRPLHEAHAIETVIVNIPFTSPVHDAAFSDALSALGVVAGSFPGRNEFRGASMPFGGGQILFGNQPSSSLLPDGVSYFRTDTRGVQIEELRLDRHSLLYATQDYLGWEKFIAAVVKYLYPVLRPIHDQCSPLIFHGSNLTYIDKFNFQGELNEFNSSLLLKQNSKYLAQFIEDSNDLWHCHVGKFIRQESGVKRLKSVRLDCLDENIQTFNSPLPAVSRVVRLESTVSDIFDVVENSQPQVSFINSIFDRYQNLHLQHKEMLTDILSDTILRKIGM